MQSTLRRLRLLAFLLGLGFTFPLISPAQDKTFPSLPPAAQAATDKGLLAVKVQNYLLAIQNFQEARQIAPESPELFYDLGLAESNLPGRELRAICWFSAYLAASPVAPNATEVKEKIAALDEKSHNNLTHLIASAQEAASKLSTPDYGLSDVTGLWAATGDFTSALNAADLIKDPIIKSKAQSTVATAQVKAGDIAGALKTSEMIQYSLAKSAAQGDIAKAQAQVGNIADAIQTAGLIKDAKTKCSAQVAIVNAQIKGNDLPAAKETLAAALSTAEQIEYALYKSAAQGDIVRGQVQVGDLAGAIKTTEQIQIDSSKASAQVAIMQAQAKAGDLVAAKETLAAAICTADLIDDTGSKDHARSNIALAQAQIGDIASAFETSGQISRPPLKNSVQISIIKTQAQAGDIAGALKTADLIRAEPAKSNAQAAIAMIQTQAGDVAGALQTTALIRPSFSVSATTTRPLIQSDSSMVTVSTWLEKLTNSDPYNPFPLNTRPFLDWDGFMKTLSSASDPQTFFDVQRSTAESMTWVQATIDQMLKADAKTM